MGRIPAADYDRVRELVPIACVDILPFRRSDGAILLIRRDDAPQGEAWAMVGGGVYRGETLAEAVGRQLRETLGPGVSWEDPDYKRPDAIGEFFPDGRPGYGHDPRKHAIAPTWLVAIEGELVPDGDEAKALRWFPRDALPPDDEIGFGHAETIHRVLASAAS